MGDYSVYRHTNNFNGRVYIGITRCKPEDRWRKGLAYKSCLHFYKAILKYGWSNFSHDILVENLTKEDAQREEVRLIALYRDSDVGCYNILPGGNLGRKNLRMSNESRLKLSNSLRFRTFSESHKQHLSDSHKGKTVCPETREKISKNNARYWSGKKRSPETIEKNRLAHMGKTVSQETRVKMSVSSPRNKIRECKQKAVIQMDLSGVPIKEWSSMKEAEITLFGHVTGGISACCKGKRKTAYGYKWKILNDKESTT